MAILKRITKPLTLALLAFTISQVHGEDVAADEYQVKAAFLYNFAKFVEWPSEAFNSTDRITICVLGNSSLAALVGSTIAGKHVGDRSFAVQEIAAAPPAGSCHILFVGKAERKRQSSLLREVQDPFVLTVGETDDFLGDGGVINLKLKQAMVRIEINNTAAMRLKCRISSKLLSLAEAPKQ